MTIRDAFISGDLSTAETLLTQAINANSKTSYIYYANRSFLMAQKSEWDRALDDALMSLRIQPSLTGCISKGIALCGQKQMEAAMKAFDLAFIFTDGDSKSIRFLLLMKAIVLFNANQHEDAMQRVRELAAACSSADTLACRMVEAYLNVQLGITALNDARHSEAVDYFTVATNTDAFSSKPAIHSIYEDLFVLFGWDIQSLWEIANQKLCDTLLCLGRFQDAIKSYCRMMDTSDEITRASSLDWSTGRSSIMSSYCNSHPTLCITGGDAALTVCDYDKAISLYSAAIDLGPVTCAIFVNRCKAKTDKGAWEEALLDAQKVIELEPSSYIGYQLKHAACHSAQRLDDAIEALNTMLSKLDDTSESHTQNLRKQYISAPEAERVIQRRIDIQLEHAPLRLLDTTIGLLCDRGAQITTFKTSTEYKELLLFVMKHPVPSTEHIREVVAKYFRCIMLSHRWDANESLLPEIRGKIVYQLHPVDGIVKLQSFCRVADDLGYRWAWMDTCCIDQANSVELHESINSMFIWYHHSALTIVYLSDVPPSSKSDALAKSVWNKRGWTFQELMASRCILFYQKDWTPYLNDRSSNHKDSNEIIEELAGATGIDRESLVAFHPGTRNVRKTLRWASPRITTRQEDIAYSLFGVFDVHLGVSYGEKQKALGRLLQEIIALSGDITALDWVGRSSEFNSCLPAEISSYKAPPITYPSLSTEELDRSVSLLRDTGAVQLASKLYTELESLHAPRFAQRRLHLPCIAFRVTELIRKSHQGQDTCVVYEVKAGGLRDLPITTEEDLLSARPTEFLLIRPWDHDLLELPDDVHSAESERALRLMVRLGQPFSAFLLKRERRKEYRRVASDHSIIAQFSDTTCVDDMKVRTLEIL
ncbi:heterokaryon incompatibility protein-domain-containing protein [Suillus spraguei]|nr:heterokaryon incompatibility protein-domain-containing protein [Suillus spraguei]